jgi:hypothetical protein
LQTGFNSTSLDISGDIDVDGTTNLDVVDVDGAVNFAADVTFADGADIITASAGTSNFRAGVNAGNSITSGGNYNTVVGDEAGTAITMVITIQQLVITALISKHHSFLQHRHWFKCFSCKHYRWF